MGHATKIRNSMDRINSCVFWKDLSLYKKMHASHSQSSQIHQKITRLGHELLENCLKKKSYL